MTAAVLTADEIQARLAAMRGVSQMVTVPDPYAGSGTPDYRHYRPLDEAADEYVAWARSANKRIYCGISEFDSAMRGLAPGELMIVQGYAHSGKTVFVTQMMLHNNLKRMALFTPDETRVLILVKLTSILHGVSAERLERHLADGEGWAEEMLRSTAREHFPHLAVFDQSMTAGQMTDALGEAEAEWGDKCQLAVFDYADLALGDGDVPAKITALKSWGRRMEVPLVVLHQSSRMAGRDGAKVKIDSGSHGGEQQATFVVGVRRKKNQFMARVEELQEKIKMAANGGSELYHDLLREAKYDLNEHDKTITFSLVKNKRPPSRLVDDVDYELDPDTGQVSRWDR